MDGSKCILQVRGVRPFLSSKYDIEKHHNYKYLADFNSDFSFDIAEFVRVFKEDKAKLFVGLNKKNTKRVIIEIDEDEDFTDAAEVEPPSEPQKQDMKNDNEDNENNFNPNNTELA